LSYAKSQEKPLNPIVARYAVVSQRPPKLIEGIVLAERIHAALVSLSNGSPVFTGCNEQGRPLQGHGHAHIFCESDEVPGNDSRGEITHITIYAVMGFGSEDQNALQGLRVIWGGEDLEVRLQLQGIGRQADFCGPDMARGHSPLLARSRTWVSRTPFIPTRHPKATRAGAPKRDLRGLQIGGPEHELRRLLGLAGLPEPVAMEPVAGTLLGGREVPWSGFLRRRANGEGRRAGGAGYGFRIEFPEAVQGPVAVGYASHFGMGGFVPEEFNKPIG
jgi:CRISPR-associated protein Csb2